MPTLPVFCAIVKQCNTVTEHETNRKDKNIRALLKSVHGFKTGYRENCVLRNMLVNWRNLMADRRELHDMYSPNYIWVIKSRKVK